MAIKFKPRPRNRRPGLGAGGSPSKRTRGYRRPKKKDYTKSLPRPTKSISSEIDPETRPVIASTPEPEAPLMPTRPPSEPAPRGTTQAGIKPAGKPDISDIPLQDPFTQKPTPPEFGSVDTDPFSDLSGEFGGPMREQPPIQVYKPVEVPTTPLGGTFTPAGTPFLPRDETQPTFLPAPAGSPIPVVKEPFVDPFNLPKTDPSKVPLFGIKKPDGTFFSPEETKVLIENNTLEELKAKFGESAIINILEGFGG
jgi:hypothetical protein